MPRPTWKVSDLLLLVLLAGMIFGTFRYFWEPGGNSPPASLLLSTYLALLAMASLGAFLGKPTLRRPCQAYAAFGWLNLVFVLWGGFVPHTSAGARWVAEGSQMGMAFGAMCALVAAWFLEPPRGRDGIPTDVRADSSR